MLPREAVNSASLKFLKTRLDVALNAGLVAFTLPVTEGLKLDGLHISSHTNHSMILSCEIREERNYGASHKYGIFTD